ncbi:ABC transporter ATP-binding protein [uncultured Ilyobacter sp.]|uniref:ABC transporter ATP-binding protein n=1 Tax=uncultured Ilyobacter sp. TaxID=544433 RepID=UPI0029C7F312|nr:ABC transporter ATP-binding protein [uncultured Ilyobacter sp.]
MISENKLIHIENFNFTVNGKKTLKNINLSVGKGEFVGLIGPNGAGKTTLIKCINGINRGIGKVLIQGREISELSEKKIAREVSLMNQNTTVTFPYSALDVVLMGRYPHINRFSFEKDRDYEIARTNMRYTDTIQFENTDVTNVSGGERQRILFAKVLTQEADIILLDEPTASLDIAHEEQIFKYARELGLQEKTVVAAVHDLRIAAQYCSRLVLVNQGKIIADGKPEEVLTPENIRETYGVNTVVYRNNLTGLLDFYIYGHSQNMREEKIHVIAGGTSGESVMRYLFDKGYNFTTGILWEGETDFRFADVFGINAVVEKSFSSVCESTLKRNIEKIKESDITILCNVVFGKQNFCNLTAAEYAKKLIIIEDTDIDKRDFTGGRANELYRKLRENAVVTRSERLHEVI